MHTPETRFAVTPDGVQLAYQVVGAGEVDIVFQAAGNQLIDLLWQEPGFVRVAKRLELFARSVWYDGRGGGASGGDSRDRLNEETADGDLTTILDAVGSARVALIGSGPDVIRYAAAHPERLRSLVLINGFPHYIREHDYPWGLRRDMLDQYAEAARSRWGTGAGVGLLCPSMAGDQAFRERWARGERLGIGVEAGAKTLLATFEQDVRSLLPTITVPTIVVHRRDNRYIPADVGRYLAQHIPGAKYIELPGADQPYYVGDTDELFDEVEEFLTGTRLPQRDGAFAREGVVMPALATDDRASAIAFLEEALAVSDELGADGDRRRILERLQQLGGSITRTKPRRPTFGWESLTVAERKVSALVAQGLTNPQIGDRLSISRRTVETHLSHIYTKLGITSRAQLAAAVVRHEPRQ